MCIIIICRNVAVIHQIQDKIDYSEYCVCLFVYFFPCTQVLQQPTQSRKLWVLLLITIDKRGVCQLPLYSHDNNLQAFVINFMYNILTTNNGASMFYVNFHYNAGSQTSSCVFSATTAGLKCHFTTGQISHILGVDDRQLIVTYAFVPRHVYQAIGANQNQQLTGHSIMRCSSTAACRCNNPTARL